MLELLAASMETLVFFLLPLVIIISAAAFSNGTVKNEIAWGITRLRFFMSKAMLCAAAALILVLFYMAGGLLLATVVSGFGGPAPHGFWVGMFKAVGLQFALLVVMGWIGNFLVFVTKRSSATIAVYIAFCLVPRLLIPLLASLYGGLAGLVNYDLYSVMIALRVTSQLNPRDTIIFLAVCTFWITVSLLGGLVLFKKAEII